MAQAKRAVNDKPGTVYFDGWFIQVSLAELIGKTIYRAKLYGSCIKEKLQRFAVWWVNI